MENKNQEKNFFTLNEAIKELDKQVLSDYNNEILEKLDITIYDYYNNYYIENEEKELFLISEFIDIFPENKFIDKFINQSRIIEIDNSLKIDYIVSKLNNKIYTITVEEYKTLLNQDELDKKCWIIKKLN